MIDMNIPIDIVAHEIARQHISASSYSEPAGRIARATCQAIASNLATMLRLTDEARARFIAMAKGEEP